MTFWNERNTTFREYLELVKLALKQITPDYFKLVTTYEPSGIVRERVFCYELYHQIRRNMKRHHTLSLNGEIDKRGHIGFASEDRKNPDFVFHIPGTFEGNTLIVEVKGTLHYEPETIADDFRTILTFIKKYQYKAGLFILYNHSFDELVKTVGQELRTLALEPGADLVYILCAEKPLKECEENLLSELRG